jgi:tetratricopeptide (TPR) repeat protein
LSLLEYSRQTIVLLILVSLVTCWGCSRKVQVQAPAQRGSSGAGSSSEAAPEAVTPSVIPPPPAPLEPAPLPTTIAKTSSYELCELNFQVGNYTKAAAACESFLRNNPKAAHRDTAWFHLGLSRALARDSGRDWNKAELAFKRLLSEFPKSQYNAQAEFILGLQAQIEKLKSDVKEREDRIKRLSEELQKLKDIDMQRRPTRP